MQVTAYAQVLWIFTCPECNIKLEPTFLGNKLKHKKNFCIHSGTKWEHTDITMSVQAEITKVVK